MAKQKAEEQDKLAESLKEFERCESAHSHNFESYKDDTDFVLLENQWPDEIKELRKGRPMLTVNKLKAHGRQVINDARQNKQSIKVHPVDSEADVETADIFNGLIRHIEANSKADAAYDTAGECAVWGGFGYLRITLDYAYDDTFDMDIGIKRVVNPLSILGDPNSTEADSCDWNTTFITDWKTEREFEDLYGDASKVDWRSDAAWKEAPDWKNEAGVMVAEHWFREKVDKPIILLSDGQQDYVRGAEELELDEEAQALIEAGIMKITDKRTSRSWKVTQRIMSGVEILKERDWPGMYIPIVPFYGDEFYIDGKRYLRSLVHSAIDSQRMYNYMRSQETELLGLTPIAPWVGPKGAFVGPEWKTANRVPHSYLEYDPKVVAAAGGTPPQRQMLDSGPALGAMQAARTASDEIKAVIGQYDASLGAQSNETSGKAIMARQREGDVATFHFIDNRARAIGHTGRILLDLIPKVYSTKRIIRVVGEDGKQKTVPLGQEVPLQDNKGQPKLDDQGQPKMHVYDLGRGKYDLTVSTGPSFTSRREEAAVQMTEMAQAFPASVPIIMPKLAKNLDWPGADEIAEEFEQLAKNQVPPEIQKVLDEGKQALEQKDQEIQSLKMDQTNEAAKIEATKQADTAKAFSQRSVDMQKLADQKELARQELADKKELALLEIAADAEVARKKAETDRELGFTNANNTRDIAAMKNDGVEQTGPDGKKVVKSGTEVMTNTVTKGLEMLGQMIAQNQRATDALLDELKRVMMAPNELQRDPKTGVKRSVKVLN